MINPADVEINIEDQQKWLLEHRNEKGYSWTDLWRLTGIAVGTVSQFAKGSYTGNNAKYAEIVFRYRQGLESQKQIALKARDVPTFFETPTTKKIMNLLNWAQQRRRIVACVGNPGLSKTESLKEYCARANKAHLITVLKSTSTVNKLTLATLRKMGDKYVRASNQLSTYMLSNLEDSPGSLIIFDDAQHLSIDQIEEVRGWFDVSNIGVAFVGNRKIIQQMTGGNRRMELAQIFSRLGMVVELDHPTEGDVEALATEWRIEDEKTFRLLTKIASKPGALRSCTHALELAAVIAQSEGEKMTHNHLLASWSQISTTSMKI
ncbi:MAG: AAA family ATPase [Parasphingorhabdus sp.]|nr:AAA family ATPase [Parasphingorhabdus sp.]|tara:strand:+ start:173 stop:1132 length:960 start_codon:yes stop_codon:yes gene_type:complete